MARISHHRLLKVASRSTQADAFTEAQRRVVLIREKFTQDTRHYVRAYRSGRHIRWGIFIDPLVRTPSRPYAGFLSRNNHPS